MDKVNLNNKFSKFSDVWSQKIVGELNENYVKLVKLSGEFIWHRHEHDDEMFLVIKGHLIIKLRDQDVHLNEGEFFIVPKGVEHMPVAPEEAQVLMVEPKTVSNTGDVANERTAEALEWI